jgi:hypothetical protein
MDSIKIFLLYNDEDISAFNHPDIIPVKLNQSKYFESEFFRMIEPEHIPDVENIGIITPSLFKKCNGITLDSLLKMRPNPYIVKLYSMNEPSENQATHYHGIFFIVLWSWILEQYDISYLNFNEYASFYSNLWITRRDLFIEYLSFAKNTMKLIDNAPLRIKEVLETNPNYGHAKISTSVLELRFGKTYYPWEPFLMERLICLFIHLKETGQC